MDGGRSIFCNFGVSLVGVILVLHSHVNGCNNVTTTYGDKEVDGQQSFWAVGVHSLNVSFKFSQRSGYNTYVITELDSDGDTVRSCTFGYVDLCDSEDFCYNCKMIEPDCLSITYSMENITDLNKSSTVQLKPNTASVVNPVLETVVNMKNCDPQDNTILDPVPPCTYNHFNCPSLLSCNTDAGFKSEEKHVVCQADATWNDTLTCEKDKRLETVDATVGIGVTGAFAVIIWLVLIILDGERGDSSRVPIHVMSGIGFGLVYPVSISLIMLTEYGGQVTGVVLGSVGLLLLYVAAIWYPIKYCGKKK